MEPHVVYSLIGLRPDGTRCALADDLPSFVDAELLREVILQRVTEFITIIVHSAPDVSAFPFL